MEKKDNENKNTDEHLQDDVIDFLHEGIVGVQQVSTEGQPNDEHKNKSGGNDPERGATMDEGAKQKDENAGNPE